MPARSKAPRKSAVPGRAIRKVLETRADPLGVLTTTAAVVARAQHVAIDRKRVESTAQVLARRPVPVPAWDYEHHYFDGSSRSVTFLFLLDALNFCFWGEPRWSIEAGGKRLDGYWALAAALKRAAQANAALLEADYLAALSPGELAAILRGQNEIPLFVERWRNAQELGRVLRDRFGGSAARVVESAGRDAAALARLVADNFSSFHDTTVYAGRAVNFFKRAQILVADLWGSFGGRQWGEFTNPGALTAFADYKLPQVQRAWGILKYDSGLARRVDRRQELARDGAEEIEIRAALLWGVELLRAALARRGRELTSAQMDSFLWETSQGPVRGMKPYHRVRTIYY